MNETLLMNIFNGSIASMPPKLQSNDQRNIVIRPLAYVPEQFLLEYAMDLNFPVIPCNLCGSQENLQRAKIKSLLKTLSKDNPNIGSSMLKSLGNIKSQLLDQKIWDFDTFS